MKITEACCVIICLVVVVLFRHIVRACCYLLRGAYGLACYGTAAVTTFIRRRIGRPYTAVEKDAIFQATNGKGFRAEIASCKASLWDTMELPVDEINAAIAVQQQKYKK